MKTTSSHWASASFCSVKSISATTRRFISAIESDRFPMVIALTDIRWKRTFARWSGISRQVIIWLAMTFCSISIILASSSTMFSGKSSFSNSSIGVSPKTLVPAVAVMFSHKVLTALVRVLLSAILICLAVWDRTLMLSAPELQGSLLTMC